MTTPAAGGHRYPMGNGTYSLLEMAAMLRPAFPEYARKIPRFEAPDWLVRIVGSFDSDMRGNLGEIGTYKTTEALDAKALLGRPFIPANEAVIATAQSAIAHKLL